MLYITIFAILLFLSYNYDMMDRKTNRDFWYNIMLVVFILVSGLRYRLGVDTPNYMDSFYHGAPTLGEFHFADYPLGNDPLWNLFQSTVKTFGGRFYWVQLIQSSIVNVLLFKYIKKHSRYIFTCLLFYAFCCYTNYNMQIMRGAIGIVLCLYANDFILEKKFLKGIMLILISSMFHIQGIVMLLMPLLFFLRMNIKGVAVIVGAFFVSGIIQNVFADYLFLFEFSDRVGDRVDMYLNDEFYGEQTKNFNGMMVQFLPDVIYSFISLIFMKKYCKDSSLLKFEPMVMIGIIFLIIQTKLQIAYRYVDYYRIYFVLFYSELFIRFFLSRKMKIKKDVAYVVMLSFFAPYVFLIGISRKTAFEQYYPYSSVIDKSIYHEREVLYTRQGRPGPHLNEY